MYYDLTFPRVKQYETIYDKLTIKHSLRKLSFQVGIQKCTFCMIDHDILECCNIGKLGGERSCSGGEM